MVYRMQGGPGGLGAQKKPAATKTEKLAQTAATKAAKAAQQAEKAELKRAINAATDEWKRYLNSLSNLTSQLKNGSIPSSYPLPAPPASDRSMVPHLAAEADKILGKAIPAAYQVAANLDAAKGARDAMSSYAAGQPPVSPGGGMVNQQVPPGEIPGEIQQAVTQANGVSPVLTQGGPGASTAYVGPQDGSSNPLRANQPMAVQQGGSKVKTILLVAGIGLAAYLAYRWWKKRKG